MTRQRRPRSLRIALGCLAGIGIAALGIEPEAIGQLAPRPLVAAPAPRPGPADVLWAAIASNPITAPYPIEVVDRDGRAVLRGVVGTKVIYDVAIRTAIASGIPFADELVIDTLAAQDVAFRGAAAASASQAMFGAPMFGPTYGATGGYPPPTYMQFGTVPGGPPGLVYPPPLFGRIDEPFFGLEPPVISYPPYWGALSARRLAEYDQFFGPATGAFPAPGGPEPPPGLVDVELDPNGVATIRGVVPTLADRITVGQTLAQTPGVTEVINLLRVDPATAEPSEVTRPTPARPDPGLFIDPRAEPPDDPDAEAAALPEIEPPAEVPPADDNPLAALPELAGLPIRASLRDGMATLEGEAPSAIEAMDAYLAVKRHPGVVEVVDRLRFSVPIEPRENPLRTGGDPRDVEEYLGDQVRRQLDGLAEVDRVRLFGDRLEIQGRLLDPDTLQRAEATLRSTPVLRGFTLAMSLEPQG